MAVRVDRDLFLVKQRVDGLEPPLGNAGSLLRRALSGVADSLEGEGVVSAGEHRLNGEVG